jgi:putative SOS response-associated peptidase YedK
LAPRYNIALTEEAPVVRQRRDPAGERTLQTLRWGLVPGWAKDLKIGARMINLRSETGQPKFGETLAKAAAWCRPTVSTSGAARNRTSGRS